MPDSETSDVKRLILLTGATGYVGGRLLSVLEQRGYRIRCLARRPEHLLPRISLGTQVVEADVLDKDSLSLAMHGVHTAFYLVHPMGTSGAFEEEDRLGARNFGEAAREAGVSAAAPYRHFRDREELVVEVARRGFDKFAKVLAKAWNKGKPDAFSALNAVGNAYLKFANKESALFVKA